RARLGRLAQPDILQPVGITWVHDVFVKRRLSSVAAVLGRGRRHSSPQPEPCLRAGEAQACDRTCNSPDVRVRARMVMAATIPHASIIAPAAESATSRPWPKATYAAWVTSLTIFVIAGVPLNCLAWELNVPVVTAVMTVF